MTTRRLRMLLVGVVLVISLVNLATSTHTPITVIANVGIVFAAVFVVWRIKTREPPR